VSSPTHEPADANDRAASSGSPERPSATFWVGLAAGWVAITIGLFGIIDHRSSANPVGVFRLLLGLNVVNDAVVVPVIVTAAFLLRRWAPRWLLAPAQVWLIIAGVVSLYAYPLVRRFGARADNTSQLPLDYAHNLVVVLGWVTLLCAALAIGSWRRDRADRP
jgi:hypothetical protein